MLSVEARLHLKLEMNNNTSILISIFYSWVVYSRSMNDTHVENFMF